MTVEATSLGFGASPERAGPVLPQQELRARPEDADAARVAKLRALSQELEASFLAEMLKTTGVNKTADAFGGGAGEDAFSSMLTQQYAAKMAASGGIGLAEHIFRSLTEKG